MGQNNSQLIQTEIQTETQTKMQTPNENSNSLINPSSYSSPKPTITTVVNTLAKIAPGLPQGPANFTSFQLPNSSTNSLKINIAELQQCIGENSQIKSINECITNNISSYDKQTGSYQNVNYVGPGHSIDTSGNVVFGPFKSIPQTFDNLEKQDSYKTYLIIYIVFVLIYLYIIF
jgi:hypothetical protein